MAGGLGAVVLFVSSVARALKALDTLDIWKDLRQVGTDKVNQVTSIICSVAEEAGDIFHSFRLADARDGEKVRVKCSTHLLPHIHGGWTKERPEEHVCTFNLSQQAVKSITGMETTDYFCAKPGDSHCGRVEPK